MTVQKPANLRLLQGNPGNRPVPSGGTSVTGSPEPPGDLIGEARAEWLRVVTHLEAVGQIERVDYAALIVYCSAWKMFDDSRAELELKGPIVMGRDGGFVKNPAIQIMDMASKMMRSYGSLFGLSPKDRQQMGMTSEAPDSDPLKAFNGF